MSREDKKGNKTFLLLAILTGFSQTEGQKRGMIVVVSVYYLYVFVSSATEESCARLTSSEA